MTPTWTYPEFVDAARADNRVVGLVLTGSRGRGLSVRPDSDWDVRLVVRNESLAACEKRFDTPHGSEVEVAVFSLSHFEQVAGELGSSNEWDRYSYVHADVVLDKLEGRIAELVAQKSILPHGAACAMARAALDGYVNAYYRSAKNARDGLVTESRLDAAESVPWCLTALFAMYERVRPFNKFLRWELETFPLGDQLWTPENLLPRLETIVSSGGLTEQQSLFRDMEGFARARGFADVVDGWEPELAFLRGA